jgi:hypothetical protein
MSVFGFVFVVADDFEDVVVNEIAIAAVNGEGGIFGNVV